MAQEPRHMSSEEFRAAGRAMVDWIAEYWERLQGEGGPPVLAQVKPGEVLAQLPERAPERGEALDAIVADVDRAVMPGVKHWQHPSFFAYFPAMRPAGGAWGVAQRGLG